MPACALMSDSRPGVFTVKVRPLLSRLKFYMRNCLQHHQRHGLLPEQVFLLFKSSRTHMMLACTLSDSASGLPSGKQGVLSVRSQQNFLSKFSKEVTGVITLEDGELRLACWRVRGRALSCLAWTQAQPSACSADPVPHNTCP